MLADLKASYQSLRTISNVLSTGVLSREHYLDYKGPNRIQRVRQGYLDAHAGGLQSRGQCPNSNGQCRTTDNYFTQPSKMSKRREGGKLTNKSISGLTSVLKSVVAKTKPRSTPRARTHAGTVAAGALAARVSRRSTGNLGLSSGTSGATTRQAQVIEEDEYIGEISGSVGFATNGYPVNIGSAAVFPWGGQIAKLYERYRFEYLEFYYRREVSEYAANGVTGKVILSFDYDSTDAAPTSKQQVEDTVPHIDGMPCSERLLLRLDPKELNAMGLGRYVLTGSQPPGTDLKTYNVGQLFVSTQGCASSGTIGELRVRYRCRLFIPQLNAVPGTLFAGGYATFVVNEVQVTSATAQVAFLAANLAQLTFPATSLINNLGVSLNTTTGVFTLPVPTAGGYSYLVTVNVMHQQTNNSNNVSASATTVGATTTLTNYSRGVTGVASSGTQSGYLATTYQDSMSFVVNTFNLVTGNIVVGTNATFAAGSVINRIIVTFQYIGYGGL